MKPAIILVQPQLGENIGAVARAMLNCGLTELRLVSPRDGWPSESAVANSAGAHVVIDNAKLFDTVADAVADITLLYATSARQFAVNLPIDDLEPAAQRIAAHEGKAGILFGPERTGLVAEDVARAQRLITIPLNPDFMSLNIGQAALLVSYAVYRAGGVAPPSDAHRASHTRPATQAELDGLMGQMTEELDRCSFFTAADKRPSMLKNLRAGFSRMELTEQDVSTWRGLIKALVLGRRS